MPIAAAFTQTTDPNIIQEWAEVRGGTPARDLNDETKLQILFGDEALDAANIQKVSWEEFFELFAENQYTFSFREENEESEEIEALSREYKIEKKSREERQ